MDDVARYNIKRWNALAGANAVFTRPALELDIASARRMLDPEGRLGEITGNDVLCLAGGGGQQSAALALLGANVTVVDLAETQVQRDRDVAKHLDLNIQAFQGDMRDLSRFGEGAFDIVWQPYSLNFVPDASVVFGEVARVIRPDGIYHFNCANPFFSGLTEKDWNGQGYLLKRPYTTGAEITYQDQDWVYDRSDVQGPPIQGAREYRHTLSMLVEGLVEHGFVLTRIMEQMATAASPDAEPGTWDHFTSIAPPWLAFWASYRPEIIDEVTKR